uniref:EGF-like domain-containing protein n=1 Tax=Neobodo designis TaxID=312471 RepID=A0A7S1L4E8_NEODS|mmetsp:Transcript_14665/g.45459  ORF Transcript_14665/g.45459 Transcript_14665/m.45459 type:complete len:240 (+) Transcript_14665:112-831(+)
MSMRASTAVIAAFVATVALSFAFLAAPAAARSPPCNCYNGQVAQRQPQCQCNCDNGYLPPDCSYAVGDNVSVEVWYDFASGQYVRSRRLEALTTNLNPSKPITFVYAKQGNYAKTAAIYKMTGRDAYNLKAHVANDAAWTTNERIFAAYDLFTRVEEAPEARSHPTVVYQHEQFAITAEGIGYLAAVVVTVGFVLLLEFCCCAGGNTADEISHDIATGVWDQRLGYDKGMAYKHEPPPE